MDDRTKTLSSFLCVVAAVTTSACGFNQQSRFQMSFLPAAPHAADPLVENLPAAPVVEPNLYLQQQSPAFLLAANQPPSRRTSGDALVMRAEQTFQQGKRTYQANDIPGARRLFDSAIDLMLEASDENPADRQDYQRRFEEMTEAIHRF